MDALVDLVAPAVELELEVGLVREPAAGLEVGAHEPVRPLEHTLRLRVAGSEDHPADAELAAEAGERVGRAATAGGIAPSRSQTSFSGSAPIRSRHAAEAPEHVRRLLREDQRARDHARPAQLRRSPRSRGASGRTRPGSARAAPTDRTAPAPPADTASAGTSAAPGTAAAPRARSRRRSTCRPCSRARSRAPAAAATGSSAPPAAARRSTPERIQLRPDRRPLVPRRRLARERPRDRVAMRPVSRWIARFERFSTKYSRLISAHCSTPITAPSSPDNQARLRDQPDNVRLSAEWSSFQPAQVVQYSGGAHSIDAFRSCPRRRR